MMKKNFLLLMIASIAINSSSFGQTVKHVRDLATLKATSKSITTTDDNVIEMQGYENPGDGGQGTFVWIPTAVASTNIPFIDPTGSVFVKAPNTTAGFWMRKLSDNKINVKWLGVKTGSTNSSTNNARFLDAVTTAVFLQNQINWLYTPPATGGKKANKLYFPGDQACYYFAETISIKDPLEIEGDAGGLNNNTGLVMNPAMTGTSGISIQHDAGTSDFTVKIKNIFLSYQSPFGGAVRPSMATKTVNGIFALQTLVAENVKVYGFPGDGFHFEGLIGSYSVDFCKLTNCQSSANTRHGFYISGGEAQEGVFDGCDARDNGRWGYYDASFLGNSYIGCTSNFNWGNADAATKSANLPDAVNGGGGFKIQGASNRSRLIGCYSENADGGNEGDQYSLVIGGTQAAPWRKQYQPPTITNGQFTVQLSRGFEVTSNRPLDNTRYDIMGTPKSDNVNGNHGLGLKTYGETDNGNHFYGFSQAYNDLYEAAHPTNNFLFFQRDNLWKPTSYGIAKVSTSKDHFGLVNATDTLEDVSGRVVFPFGLYLRSFDNVTTDPAKSPNIIEQYRGVIMAGKSPMDLTYTRPESLFHGKKYAVGDIVFNTNPDPANGGNPNIIGWRCTTAGIPNDTDPLKRGAWQSLIVGQPTAVNGLSINGTGNLELGGSALTHATNIDLATFGLNLQVSGVNKIGFINNATAGGIFNLNNSRFISSAGNSSVFIGFNAGNTTTTALNNTAVGVNALQTVGTSANNTAIGSDALKLNTGAGNVAVGRSAISAAGAAQENVAVGWEALINTTSGAQNTALGRQAMGSNSTGHSNTVVGAFALGTNTSGTWNTSVGRASGGAFSSGSFNVFIGGNAGPAAGSSLTTASNKLFINSASSLTNTPLIGGDFITRKVTINRNLSTSTLFYTLDVNGTAKFAGSVSIGTDVLPDATFSSAQTLGYNLLVKGKILTEEVVIKPFANWPDYVFEKGYNVISLKELKKFIDEHKHLPNIISAEDMKKSDGIPLGNMQIKLLEKIEELTIYAIDADKNNEVLRKKVESLEERLKKLESILEKQKNL